nr:reverse transcriptase domain-containing protein [Tanacetum cinerariifolium]GEY09411.1 reverse transcriptase domain-containing protein [Tanacetum cinerariifolium]
MSTRSSARYLFLPLDNPELTIQRRSRTNPTLLNNSEMTAEGNCDLPVPDLRTMEELCHPSLNGRCGPIATIDIHATNFGLRNDMIQQVENSCQFHGLLGDDANNHLDKFLHITLSIKVNGVTDDALRLYIFPHSMTRHATAWFDRLLRNSINTFEQMAKMFLRKYFPPSMVTKLRNEITNFRQHLDESLFKAWEPLKAEMAKINKNLMRVLQVNQQVKVVAPNYETCSVPHSFSDCRATVGQTQNVYAAGAYTVSAPKPNLRPSIPYPSRLHDQKLHDKANDQREKFFQIFKDLNFNISFADALILMEKFGPTIKTFLTNKDKLSELARTPLNEHCLANKLSLPDLSPTCTTLELADRSISRPVRVEEDVFVKVGTFHFPADFVVVDFDVDPRVPLILVRSFRKTGRALIDVFEGKLTLRVGKEAITFNLYQTSRYSANYNNMTANRINVIDMACEEYSQEVLGFFDVIASGNPTPYYDPIVSTTSSTLTPFENIDFLLEEVDAFLALEDDLTSSEVDQSYVNNEGDILLLETFLNDDPSLPPPNQGNYLPQVRKELKICEAKTKKSSIYKPPEVELKDLPPHLEYTFPEGGDKLSVIITKYFSVEEKTVLIMVLKSHKRAIAWKLSDIKVIENEENELILTRLVTRWCVCIDYRKLNEATRKDHFPLRFMDQMLERLAGNQYYCFLDGFFGYFQIPIDLKDQEKTTFTCPYGTFAYHRMPFGLCNAPGTFQRVLLRQEFTFKVIDTLRAENLATDHLSRLDNSHQNVLDPKGINESFPLETLNLVSTRGNSSTPWFADFTNYQAGNFVVKEMSSQQKNKFFKDVKHYF